MQTLNPADFLDTTASPKQSKATSEATTSGAEARYADMAKGAEAQKKQAEADIANATSLDQIREARAKADKAEVDLQAARDALAKGPAKSVTEIELEAKAKGAKSRAAVVRAQMLNNIQLYKNEIKGQPASRLFGYLEQFDKPSFGGVVPAIPAYENFTKANAAILPLIRPLVAQSAKEGDSDKEMEVFMAYIPAAGDSDRAIETKYAMLDTLIAGMADGRPPSEIVAMGVKPRNVDDIEMSIRRELAPNEVKGYRLSATTEGKIRALYADKQLTPEAYADLVVTGAIEAGLKPDEAFKADALAKGAEAVGNMEKGIQWGGFSYGDVDKAAKEGLAWPEAALSGAINLPYSALETFAETGKALTVGLPETVQTLGKLAGDAIGVTDGETLQALGEFYANRYGTEQGFKEAIAQNPFEVLLDASTVSGVLGKVGKIEAATKLSNALDPVNLAARVAKLPFQAAAGSGRLAREGVTEALGVTTGAGGDALRVAAKAGREGGEGAKTFLENMRGGGSMEDVLNQAREAVGNIRKGASEAYRTGMLDVSKDKSFVDFTPIYDRLSKLRERAYIGDKVKNPSAAAVYEKAKSIVDDWNTSDPAVFHTPEGMDGLKQRLGDLSNDFATENNRRAASIASGVYDEVRKSINNQVPSYAKVMEGYETATKTLRDIENTLSLKPGAQVDTSLRKLQSIMRNNANTNYGRRVELGRTLEDAGAEGLFPSLAGQQLSAKTPRGLGQITAGGSILGAIPTGGASLFGLPLASPRLMGEAAFKAGQATGAVERAVTPFMQSMAGRTAPYSDAILGLAEKYKANRLPIQGGMAALQGLEGAQMPPEEQINVTATEGYPAQAMADLAARYAASPAAAEPETAAVPVEGSVLIDNRPTEIREDGRRYFVGTNELAEADNDPLLDRSDPALGMYRGGTVQAFGNGGQAKSPPKRTSWYDDLTMAASRRGNNLVAAAADLADKYGLTPANATAWIAQNVAGYSPQQAAQIRRNLSGVSNRAIVNAGAVSNETRFRNSGGVGARAANEVTLPARLSDIAYRPADVPRAVMSETPKAFRAAGNYLTSTSPQTMLSDAQRAGSAAVREVMSDPYGYAFDTMFYGAMPLPAAAFDVAEMRGGSRELAQYAQDDPEAARAKAMFDALAVLPVAGAGGIAGRRLTRRR